MTAEELQKVEDIVNEKIRENLPVVIKNMPIEEAKKTGAAALFGEKYGDIVRVVSMGEFLYRILWWYTCKEYRKHHGIQDPVPRQVWLPEYAVLKP